MKSLTIRQYIASGFSECFEVKERDDKSAFYCVKDDCKSEELMDLIRECHDDGHIFPNDYIYEFIVKSFDIIAESNDGDDVGDYIQDIDSSVDIYNHKLLKWVSSHLSFSDYVDRAIQEMECKEFFKTLQVAQLLQREEIFNKVFDFVNSKIEESENA